MKHVLNETNIVNNTFFSVFPIADPEYINPNTFKKFMLKRDHDVKINNQRVGK